ncbi:Nitrogen assimilation transcription factor nit-4 [Smittium culicis]|uniref:Nitrogen assimilation transcription factor nit-4 n=1 Tax=Smittium culicis TaxID=133412 RepID=A0A1R1X352_9FUNG|nr:Nitrogen assimilation transcription factor nit-4 [Smittium culicis]
METSIDNNASQTWQKNLDSNASDLKTDFPPKVSDSVTNKESSLDSTSKDIRADKTNNKRISLACMLCRRKKIKCDSILPHCTNCKNRGTQCIYAKERKRGRPPRVYTYGDLIPPGKPIAPEVQSAIEDAIINSSLLTNNINNALNHEISNDPPQQIHKDPPSTALSNTPNFYLKDSQDYLNSTQISAFSYGNTFEQKGPNNLIPTANPKYPLSTNPLKNNTANFYPRIDDKLLDSHSYPAKNSYHRNSLEKGIKAPKNTHYPPSYEIPQYPEIVLNESTDRFFNLFLSQIPIFNKNPLIDSISNKTIPLPLYLVILAVGTNNLNEGINLARICSNLILLNTTIDPQIHPIKYHLYQAQTLFILSVFYFMISEYTVSSLMHKKALDHIINGNLISIDLEATPGLGTTSSSSSSSYNLFEIQSGFNYANNKPLSNDLLEEVRRICWMIFVLDRKLALVHGHDISLYISHMSINLPEENPELDSCTTSDSDLQVDDHKPYQSFLVRSFQQAISAGTTNKTPQLIESQSPKLPNSEKSIIIKYIVSALKIDCFFQFIKEINNKQTPLISLNELFNSLKISNSITSDSSNKRRSFSQNNSGSYKGSFSSSKPKNASPNDQYNQTSTSKKSGRNSAGQYLFDSFSRQYENWLNSALPVFNKGMSFKPLNSSSKPLSYISNTISFCEKIMYNEISFISYILICFSYILETDYNSIFFSYDKEYHSWIDFTINCMTQFKNKNSESDSFYKFLESNNSLFDFRKSSTEAFEKQKSIVLEIVSLLISSTFHGFTFENQCYKILPSVSRNSNKLLIDKTNELFIKLKISSQDSPYYHLPDLVFEPRVIDSLKNTPEVDTSAYLDSNHPISTLNIEKSPSSCSSPSNSNKQKSLPTRPLEYWKKSVDIAFFNAASCADFARTLAFASVLSINLSKDPTEKSQSASSNVSSSALECLRYSLSSSIGIVSSARVLLTCYKLFPIMEAANACILGFDGHKSEPCLLKLKRVNLKNPSTRFDANNESKPAVWYVLNANSEKIHSKNDSKSDMNAKNYTASTVNKNADALNDSISSLLMPYRISDILHGLAALLSLMETMRSFWNFDSELTKFEIAISKIQEPPKNESISHNLSQLNYLPHNNESIAPNVVGIKPARSNASNENELIELNHNTRVNSERNSVESEIIEPTIIPPKQSNGTMNALLNETEITRNENPKKRVNQFDKLDKMDSSYFDIILDDEQPQNRLFSSFSNSLKSKNSRKPTDNNVYQRGQPSAYSKLPAHSATRSRRPSNSNVTSRPAPGYHQRISISSQISSDGYNPGISSEDKINHRPSFNYKSTINYQTNPPNRDQNVAEYPYSKQNYTYHNEATANDSWPSYYRNSSAHHSQPLSANEPCESDGRNYYYQKESSNFYERANVSHTNNFSNQEYDNVVRNNIPVNSSINSRILNPARNDDPYKFNSHTNNPFPRLSSNPHIPDNNNLHPDAHRFEERKSISKSSYTELNSGKTSLPSIKALGLS